MNERIEELAEQAIVNAVSKNFTGADLNIQMPSDIWTKEFAELIVKECISLFDGTKETKTVGLLTHEQVVAQIKKRFGIK